MKWLRNFKRDKWLPYLMPWVWKLIFVAFAIGISVGVGLAAWTLSIRGLL